MNGNFPDKRTLLPFVLSVQSSFQLNSLGNLLQPQPVARAQTILQYNPLALWRKDSDGE